jgi:hypothetical protein
LRDYEYCTPDKQLSQVSLPVAAVLARIASRSETWNRGGDRLPMFEQIERMKCQYTDKYVVVDATRPELARFRDVVGRVKTVNMSGRALVEFDDYHLNIGWYDIDTEFLKVVDKPPPKAAKAEVKKAAVKADAAQQGKPAPAAGPKAGKASVADILAAARGEKAAAAPAKAKEKAAPAAAKPQTESPKPAKVDRSKMSVAEMLAAARAEGAGGAAAKPQAAPAAPEAEVAPVPTQAAPEESASDGPAASRKIQAIDKSNMSIDDIVAWCRQHDAK